MSEQNPPRRAGHDSTDWANRCAADIADLNRDYHDFEGEVARIIRAFSPTERRVDALKAALTAKVEDWRVHAQAALTLADKFDVAGDESGNGFAFRKERRIWSTCADELSALLADGPGEKG